MGKKKVEIVEKGKECVQSQEGVERFEAVTSEVGFTHAELFVFI